MMLILAVLLVTLVAIWYFEPKWASEESLDKTTTAITTNTKEAYTKSKGWFGQFKLPFQKDKNTATEQFVQWLHQSDVAKRSALYKRLPEDAAEFAAWIDSLADDELNAFVSDLASVCRTHSFELGWLVDPQTPDNLKRAIEDAVILHGLAAWKARDIQPLLAYKAWQAAPNKAENRAFAQKLYGKLAEAGLVTPPSTLILATDKERQEHVAATIEKAAAEKEATFMALVQETVNELEAEKKMGKAPEIDPPLDNGNGSAPKAAEIAA
ncbi:MAG: hypothetical protein KDJ52_07210 [Anaerolineae bacterium]|nr:hypothetical protein [Anaerolineae bacterium]